METKWHRDANRNRHSERKPYCTSLNTGGSNQEMPVCPIRPLKRMSVHKFGQAFSATICHAQSNIGSYLNQFPWKTGIYFDCHCLIRSFPKDCLHVFSLSTQIQRKVHMWVHEFSTYHTQLLICCNYPAWHSLSVALHWTTLFSVKVAAVKLVRQCLRTDGQVDGILFQRLG